MKTLINTIIKDKEKRQEIIFRKNLISTGEVTRVLWYGVWLGNFNDLTEICLKFQGFPIRFLKGFSPGVFNILSITHSKNSNKGNLELKSELICFFFKRVLKATVVNSYSHLEA